VRQLPRRRRAGWQEGAAGGRQGRPPTRPALRVQAPGSVQHRAHGVDL